MDEELTFGQWLRRGRKARDLTQAELGRRVGCAAGTIRKLEADELRPSREVAARIAAQLGVPASEQEAFVAFARGQADAPAAPFAQPLATPGDVGSREPPDRAPHFLPVQPTPFIGREREVAAVLRLLVDQGTRLVTLLGPGGAGKTRLALEVGQRLFEDFTPRVPNGVWFVDLAPIADPALVAPRIAATLGVKETGGQSLAESIKSYLARKQLLLVLDNLEQVTAAAMLVDELLRAAPGLIVLATSRAVLGVYGERGFPVPPLALPEPGEAPPEELGQYSAVRLFVERARAARPDFALTSANATAVADICRRLDGLPLAIELAAVRVRTLPPQALIERLRNTLQVLIGGPRTLPARHQTLRATIDWSYNLLDDDEQTLLPRLGVFVGGWTLEAAEDVCTIDGDLRVDVLDGLQSLVDKSLVRASEPAAGEARFTMLETIREYALERLAERDEVEPLRERHARFFLALVETAERHRSRLDRAEWLRRLEIEHDNMRAALAWSREQADGDLMLRMAGALYWFWEARDHYAEGRGWIEAALRKDDARDAALPRTEASRRARARALYGTGQLGTLFGDYAAAQPQLEESLRLFRGLDDDEGLALVLNCLGMVEEWWHRDYAGARAFQEESAAIFRRRRSKPDLAWALLGLAGATLGQGNAAAAGPLFDESRALYEAMGDRHGVALALGGLAAVAVLRNDPAAARELLEQGLAIMREINSKSGIGLHSTWLGELAASQGDYAYAVTLLRAGLPIWEELGTAPRRAFSLQCLGNIMLRQRDYGAAATLFDQALDLSTAFSDESSRAWSLHGLARLALHQGDKDRARVLLHEALTLFTAVRDKHGTASCLEAFAALAVAENRPERAARLLAAADARREPHGPLHSLLDKDGVDATLAAAREQLDGEEWQAAWAAGRAMTAEEAVAYALEEAG